MLNFGVSFSFPVDSFLVEEDVILLLELETCTLPFSPSLDLSDVDLPAEAPRLPVDSPLWCPNAAEDLSSTGFSLLPSLSVSLVVFNELVVEVDARVITFFVRLGTVELRGLSFPPRRSDTRPGRDDFFMIEDTFKSEAELETIVFGFDGFSEKRATFDSRANLIILTLGASAATLVGGGDGVLSCTLIPVAG